MLNLKYAFTGLSKRVIFTLLAILQLTVSFILLYDGIYIQDKLTKNNKNILNIIKDKDIYLLKNNQDYYQDLFKEKVLPTKYEKFDNYLKKSLDFTHVSCLYSYNLINNFKNNEKFLCTSFYSEQKSGIKFIAVKSLSIDSNFLKCFSLETSSGRTLKTEDFKIDGIERAIPILLGQNYKHNFKLGQIIKKYDNENNIVKKLKVVGFLKENQCFLKNSMHPDVVNLGNYIIFPISKVKKQTILKDQKQNDIQYKLNLYNDIMQSMIVINNKKDSQKIVKSIENKSKDIKFYDIKGESYKKYIERFNDMYKTQNTITNTIFIIVFAICGIGIISNMLYSITKRYKEFGVHILCGASIYDILFRLIYEIMFMMSISTILCYYGIKLLKDINFIVVFQLSSFLKLVAIIVILTIVIASIPVGYILTIQTNNLLRRKE